MDYLNPVFGQSENNQLEIVIIAIRISKQRYQISTESTMRKGIQSELISVAWINFIVINFINCFDSN